MHLIKNKEGKEVKINLFWSWIPVGGGGHKEKVHMADVFCIHI
jgi:hypothetical protein